MRDKFEKMAKENGATLSKNADKILAIKARNIDEYACPCHPTEAEYFCMSAKCKQQLEETGKCFCGLFIKEN